MGWAFRDLLDETSAGKDATYLERIVRAVPEWISLVPRAIAGRRPTRTSADDRSGDKIEIPEAFVAPTCGARGKVQQRAHSKGKKGTGVTSRAYSKRATGPTASSAARETVRDTHSGDTVKPAQTGLLSAKRGGKEHHGTVSTSTDSVDYVYDVRTRRRLREEMDRDRQETRDAAVAREAQMRTEHTWITSEGSTASSSAKAPPREAWGSSDVGGASDSSCRPSQASSTSSSRISNKTTTSTSNGPSSSRRPRPSPKSSIAPNVSDWQHQAVPRPGVGLHSQARDLGLERQRAAQREHEVSSVASSLDAFERRLDQHWHEL